MMAEDHGYKVNEVPATFVPGDQLMTLSSQKPLVHLMSESQDEFP